MQLKISRPALPAVALAAGLTLAVGIGGARAADDADAAKGIVQEHCAGCHEVPGYANPKQTPAVNPPAFSAIAADPETYTEARLRAFLQKPHWPMQQFRLSPSDIDNLLAFIASLKGD